MSGDSSWALNGVPSCVSMRHGRRGFTLLEVVISLTLIILLMAGVFEYYNIIIKARQVAIANLRESVLMRSLLQQMADEIRQIADITPGDGKGFNGMKEQLTFVRFRMPDGGSSFDTYDDTYTGKPSTGRQDLMRITYYRERDREVQDDDGKDVCRGLVREQSKILDPNPSGYVSAQDDPTRDRNRADAGDDVNSNASELALLMGSDKELFAPEIQYLRFEYFDGATWHKSWSAEELQSDNGSTSSSTGSSTGGSSLSGSNLGGMNLGSLTSAANSNTANNNAGAAASGGDGSGGSAGTAVSPTERVSLPQAIRITIGRVKGPWPDDADYSPTDEDQQNLRTYHPDRWSIEVYLRQADTTKFSSRQHGRSLGDEDQETVEQTQGGGK